MVVDPTEPNHTDTILPPNKEALHSTTQHNKTKTLLTSLPNSDLLSAMSLKSLPPQPATELKTKKEFIDLLNGGARSDTSLTRLRLVV